MIILEEILVFILTFLISIPSAYEVYIFLIIISLIVICHRGVSHYMIGENMKFSKNDIWTFIPRNIFNLLKIFTILFFIDKYLIFPLISDEIKDFQRTNYNAQSEVEYLDNHRIVQFINILGFKLNVSEDTEEDKSEEQFTTSSIDDIIINPQKLDYHDCLKNIKVKYQTQHKIVLYGEDKSNGVICKMYYKLTTDEFNNDYHDTILTVSKKENK
ncbi:MAG: hypothetical protein KN64_03470 [Sulfurovum sp. AS07-7]|nr:MAG: hypothetical protein KN64_03470 [Sulfurovum sp. AS07-7]